MSSLEAFRVSDSADDLRLAIESALGEGDLRFDESGPGSPRIRAHDRGREVLVDVAWREQSSGSGGSGHGASSPPRSWTVRRTILFFDRPEHGLPEFELVPRRTLGDRIGATALRLLGVPTLEIEDHPEFASRYTIVTANAESVRALLTRTMPDAFALVGDLRVKVVRDGIVVHRAIGSSWSDGRDRDERLDEDGRRRFVEDALDACRGFTDDPQAARRAADAVKGSYAAEATETFERQGGLLGRAIRRLLVTRDMADSIREQVPPRVEVPGPIARRAWRGTTFPILVLGGLAAGFIAMGAALLTRSATGGDDRIVGAVFGGVGLVPALIAGFILRHRWRRQRLVRRGVVVEGVVKKVERTNTTVNNDRIHRVHFAIDGEGDPVLVKVGSAEAAIARRLQKRGTRTWILRDPDVPARAVWIEGWVIGDER